MATREATATRGVGERSVSEIHEAYPLRTVARLTGLSADVIRAWEKRYGVVDPVRGPRGARLYSSADVRRLRLLARIVASGRAIGDVAKMTVADLTALGLAEEISADAAANHRGGLIEDALEAVRRLDGAKLDQLLGDALLALGGLEFVRKVVSQLLVEIGERWTNGDLSVAEEHFFSASMRNLVGGLLRSRSTAGGPTVLLATPRGERHEFGLLIAAFLIADAGLDVCYLGVDLPASEIIAAAHCSGAAAAGLSLVNADLHADFIAQIDQIARGIPSHCELWLGGREAAVIAGALADLHAQVLDDIDKMGREVSRLRAAAMMGTRGETI